MNEKGVLLALIYAEYSLLHLFAGFYSDSVAFLRRKQGTRGTLNARVNMIVYEIKAMFNVVPYITEFLVSLRTPVDVHDNTD